MSKNAPIYPTREHQQAADIISENFVKNYRINAVLPVNSCARGKATRDSCLDIILLAKPGEEQHKKMSSPESLRLLQFHDYLLTSTYF